MASINAPAAGSIFEPPIGPTYLSKNGLSILRQYKYASGLSGYIDNVIMTPFWERVVTLLPINLAPNLVTFISLMSAVCAYAVLSIYTPTMSEVSPSWTYFAAAAFIFIYQTLDAVDGKQARRTGSSSPLGQLFDHGCDALCSFLTGIFLASAVGFGPTMLTLITFHLSIVPFYLSNWEESVTGVMRFGIIGVTEGQLVIIAILIATGIIGTNAWKTPIIGGIEFRVFFLALAYGGVIFQVVTSIIEVFKHYQDKTKHSAHTPPVQQPVTQLLQFLVYIALSYAWVLSPASTYERHTRVVLFALGLNFALQVSRLIICHVTMDPYPTVLNALIPMPFVVINEYLHKPIIDTDISAYVYLLYVAVLYTHFIYVSINQITYFLGIRCFHIQPKTQETNNKKN